MVWGQEGLIFAAHAIDILLIGLVARSAWTAHRMTSDAPLRRFAMGFLLLGLSHVVAVALEYTVWSTPDLPEGSLDAFDVLFWAYYLATLGGFAFVFASFGRHPFRWTPVLTPVLLVSGLLLESLVLLEMFFVVLHAGLNHIARARRGSLQTAFGFFLLLLGHFAFFLDYQPLTPRAPIGEIPSTLGYLLLWHSIARPRWPS